MSRQPTFPGISEHLAGSQKLRIEEVGRDVDAIRGTVKDNSIRKKVFLSALKRSNRSVLNELGVECAEPLIPLRLLGALKRDPFLQGVSFSLGDRARYKSTFHVDCFTGTKGEITLNGCVPSKDYQAYLESKLWLAPCVSRVINLTAVATSHEDEPDPASVLFKLVASDPAFEQDLSNQVSATAQQNTLHLRGRVASLSTLCELEHDAWAIPNVHRVQNHVRVIH